MCICLLCVALSFNSHLPRNASQRLKSNSDGARQRLLSDSDPLTAYHATGGEVKGVPAAGGSASVDGAGVVDVSAGSGAQTKSTATYVDEGDVL